MFPCKLKVFLILFISISGTFKLWAQDTLPMYLQLDFSNDLLNKTDRYYTQGLQFVYSSPHLARHSSGKLLPGSTKSGIKAASLFLFQDLYTPVVYNLNVYNPNDRPYCGVLAGGYRYLKVSDNMRRIWLTTYLTGVVGKYALGQATQNGIHDIIDNLEALGWSYQIKNGFLLNAGFSIYQSIFQSKTFSCYTYKALNLGSYKDNLQAGIMMQLGQMKQIDEFSLGNSSLAKFNHCLQLKSHVNWIWHDATLQGALFQNDDYGFNYQQLVPFTWYTEISYRCKINGFTLAATQKVISPEFKQAYWHKWVTLSVGKQF